MFWFFLMNKFLFKPINFENLEGLCSDLLTPALKSTTQGPRPKKIWSNLRSNYGGGGGGFFHACQDLGRMFDHSFPTCSSLSLSLSLLKCRLARALYFRCLCQYQSTVAQRAETTVAECSLTICVWVRFQIGPHTMHGQRHSQPTPTSLSQGCMRA